MQLVYNYFEELRKEVKLDEKEKTEIIKRILRVIERKNEYERDSRKSKKG